MNPILARLWNWLHRRLALRRTDAGTVAPAATAAAAVALPSPLVACATVVIPALNEARHIAEVVRYAQGDAATAEVLVVDDSSIDDTVRLAREAGARVITSTLLGKGASMHDGARDARRDLVVYLDGDLSELQSGIVSRLCRPLVSGEADFVKACFGRSGGRVTELTAKPMLKVFFPELAPLSQPLGGIVAARASLLRSLSFENGYGVDIGLLIDAQRAGARIVEVDIGSLQHDSQPLMDLTSMANEISHVIFTRARAAGRLHMEQIAAMVESQRQAMATLEAALARRRGRTRLLLLDMDGTITPARFVLELARATGREDELARLIDGTTDDAVTRSERIAALFRFVHRREFDRVAHTLPLRPGVVDCVNRMRRAGFMVGVISDSWFVAAEILRRRVFADFALAHTLQFDGDVCTGRLNVNPAFIRQRPTGDPAPCKSHAVRRLRDDPAAPAIETIWAVGDNLNDLEMLREADRAFVIDPKQPHLARDADAQRLDSFDELQGPQPAGMASGADAPRAASATTGNASD